MRSATRMGWLIVPSSSTTPWPRRILLVRAARYPSHTSGPEEWANSSRKWCSTIQT